MNNEQKNSGKYKRHLPTEKELRAEIVRSREILAVQFLKHNE
jgi:hypothetical protein